MSEGGGSNQADGGGDGRSGDPVKVSDIKAMAAAGVMFTPAVAVDGVVKLAGRIPKADEVRGWITA